MSGKDVLVDIFVGFARLTRTHVLVVPLSPQVTTVGADSFIAKPISGDTLTEAIRDYAVQVAPALPVVTNDDDQNPHGQTPLEVPTRHLDISADLMSARNEQADFLFMAAAEFDDFLREAQIEFEEDMAIAEAAGMAVSDKLFAVHRLKGALYTARLAEMGDLAKQIEAELKEVRAMGGRLTSGGCSAVAELRRRLDRLRQSLG
jgi:HPt (histidine-containing phosphotransfer) domain-containing protein